MIQKLLATALAVAFPLAVQATTLTDLDPGAGASFYYKDTLVNNSNKSFSFNETLSFNLPTPTSWTASGGVLGSAGLWGIATIWGQGFSSLSLSVFGQTYTASSDQYGNILLTVPNSLVAAGSYDAIVSGTVRDPKECILGWCGNLIQTHPSYSFSLQALPVPEPETYAMLLAGLGLVGAISRRRRKN